MKLSKSNSSRKWRRFACIGALCSAFTISGCHRWKHKSPEEKMQHVTERVQDKLDLNETQKLELDKLGVELVAVGKRYHGERKSNLEFMIKQIEGQELDEKELLTFMQGRIDNIGQSLPTIVSQLKSFHSTLDPEQKQKIASIFRDRLDDIAE